MKCSLLGLVALLAASVAQGQGRDSSEVVELEVPSHRGRAQTMGYFVGLAAPVEPRDVRPDAAGRLDQPPIVRDGPRMGVDLQGLWPVAAAALHRAAQPSQPVTYGAFIGALEPLVAELRGLPATRADLARTLALDDGERWGCVEVDSPVVRSRRRLHFPWRTAVLVALDARARSLPSEDWPVGTWLVADELDASGHVEETHAMVRRVDREWDFVLYDHQGRQAVASPVRPKVFRAPLQCFACHQGANRIVPLRDFPAPSVPVGSFQPRVLVDLDASEAQLCRAFTSPGDKADRPMGQYGGIAAVLLRRLDRAGTLPAALRDLMPAIAAVQTKLGR